MKKLSPLLVALLLGASTVALAAGDHDHHAARPDSAKQSDAAQIEKAKAAYPLDTCVVSGDKLGEMGPPFEYVHRESGKPDRVVLFCCKDCVKDFKKNPAKYLKELDAAAAAKAHPAAGHQH